VIDRVRYLLAVLNLIVLPSGVLFWLVIHLWAPSWRKLGPTRTYLVVLAPVIALGSLLFQARRSLLSTDLGANRILIAIAVILYGAMTSLELQYWRHLSIATLLGVPEVSPSEQRRGRLLQTGIYRAVRHPRYLSAGIGVIANALVINYVGFYAVILLVFPAGYVVMLLEERELVDRFGEEYRQYQRDVPQIVPRLRRTR